MLAIQVLSMLMSTFSAIASIVVFLQLQDNMKAQAPRPSPPRKLTPIKPEALDELIEEGRRAGEQAADHNRANGHHFSGAEKQRVALGHIKKRMEAKGLSVDPAVIILQLENAIQKAKEQP